MIDNKKAACIGVMITVGVGLCFLSFALATIYNAARQVLP